ncbi:VWA-like domain-containing protein [bacterium]|nr:VWA-like domain-containing protein [bacterium]
MADESTRSKLMKARCRLMLLEPWYGHVAMNMIWKSDEMSWLDEKSRTMGVRIVDGGVVECVYYPPFVDMMTMKELYAVIQHEIEHIVRCHCIRVQKRNPAQWNIAADMCVNGRKSMPRIGYKEASGKVVVPLDGKIVWIPKDWPADETTEYYYNRLQKEANKQQIGNSSGEAGQSDAGEEQFGQMVDDHSVWSQSNVSSDEARQVVKDMVSEATSKSQGSAPGHLLSAIEQLNKPIVKWREILRSYIGRNCGNQRKTYSRSNRRRQSFGTKGVSHHACSNVNVIIDTSGSIDQAELQQFFAEIEAIGHRANISLLQWDYRFQGYVNYRRGDWKKLKVKGRGGTDMAAPINWLCDNNLVKDVQIMLTDGECNYAEDKKIPFVCVLTNSSGERPNWGKTVLME